MSIACFADTPSLPAYSQISSITRMAQPMFDPRRCLTVEKTVRGSVSLQPAISDTATLLSLKDNWDSFGSIAPKMSTVLKAIDTLGRLSSNVSASGYPWENPHVSASENGEVVFEWWVGTHKLTIYVSDQDVEFIRVWGTDIVEEMADGKLAGEGFTGLWRWLNA
jgi:hypothetical protein